MEICSPVLHARANCGVARNCTLISQADQKIPDFGLLRMQGTRSTNCTEGWFNGVPSSAAGGQNASKVCRFSFSQGLSDDPRIGSPFSEIRNRLQEEHLEGLWDSSFGL